ncbi:sodium channel and clathrin linker 1 isoform X2 [Neodiprion pinetum]|uniref:sodium channel and clathrin linker 1 isoform X2 n=1 Tax=Neodiprion pinetum TaxID=441929 RepID=UPI001EDFC7E4|nr:sodium channel and clathrin linker 1-like isoform X2 [Neodiprion pinetum]
MEFEQGLPLENTEKEGSTIIKEYVITVENLKQELQNCKVEQAALRSQLGNIQESNKATAATVRDTFSKSQINDNGVESPSTKEMISNLQKRITIVQMEKESVFQLWQMALKAIDILEEELRGFHRDGKGTKFYEEQMNGVRETYSDAIKALEAKLVQARENFIKQQTLWETSKDKINVLTTEKDELLRQFLNLQKDSQEKDLAAQQRIETLKAELTLSKSEVRRVTESQIKLEAKLREAQQFIATVVAKDNEAKSKVSEAIELVESAVKEKELALQREARAVEERLALENNVPKIVEEYKTSLETEISKLKEAYERNIKKYALDMKELKVELQQKSTLLDRAQRESRLVEEELNKVRLGSDDFLHHSNAKFLALQQQLQDAEFKLQVNEETCRKKYTLKIQQLEQHVTELEEKLIATGDQLKRMQKQSCREMEERVREADERTKEAVERVSDTEHRCKTELIEKMKILQEKCDRRTKELTQHVETHQKLSNKWKEEAKRLTSSFRKRLKELRAKVIALQKENEELNKELLASRYQLAEFREKMIHRYDQGDTPR